MLKTFSLILLYSSLSYGSEALTTNTMADVFQKVEEKSKLYGRENVLVVFDIDNTILTATSELGSDQWYSWQEKIVGKPNCKPECITNDINELISAQGFLFNLNPMVPTEVIVPQGIKKLQALKQKIILLTSRGHEVRNLTESALTKNQMDFSGSSLKASADVARTYLPYDINQIQAAGLSDADVTTAGLKQARPVSFQNGVYMTAGQNKGIMLKVLLNKYKKSFKAIIFADDHQRHVDRMQAILGQTVDLTTYRYGAIDSQVEKFNSSDKTEVTQKWYKLQETIKEIGF